MSGNHSEVPNKQTGNGVFMKKIKENIVVLILIVLFVFFSTANTTFLTYANMISILKQASFYGILSLGMMMSIITAGIDLSLAGNLCLSGMIYAYCAQTTSLNLPMGVAALLALAAGTLMGIANGAMISKIEAPPFIATLATGQVAQGIALMICGGKSISRDFPDGFTTLGKGKIGSTGIPWLILIWIALAIIIYLLMDKSRFGRRVYMLGGNKVMAITSGTNVKRILLLVYTLSGILASIAGILMTSRTASASPLAGEGYELDCVAAAVIGGTSLTGGSGNVWRVLVGVIVISTITVGMNVLGVGTYVQDIVKGLIIAFAVILDVKTNKK